MTRMRSIFQGGPDTLEVTIMNFSKMIYENVEKKKHLFHNKHIEVL